ncbi:hypothetical protein GT002_21815 [Streptomyces sp. SID4917]|nr:hypothetical protein [Streptomyces sp. SID4917]
MLSLLPEDTGSRTWGSPGNWDDLGAAGVITASEPSWMPPFTGLSPRQFDARASASQAVRDGCRADRGRHCAARGA